MHGNGPKGLRNRPRLTQTSYKQAVAQTVADLRKGDLVTDQDIADAWGVSPGTVANAQQKKHDLSALPLLMLGDRFGPEALDTVLTLIGAKAVRDDAVTLDAGSVPCDLASVLPLLIDLFRDGECSKEDTETLDKAGAIDCILRIAEWLRQQRNAARLAVVS